MMLKKLVSGLGVILYTIKTEKVAITNDVRKRVRDPFCRFETLPFGAC